jgi:hypothetical protein
MMVGLSAIFTIPIALSTLLAEVALDIWIHERLEDISNALAQSNMQFLRDDQDEKGNNGEVVIFDCEVDCCEEADDE